MSPDLYLVIDFEATCCNAGTVARQEMEIIEIGAVMVRAGDLVIIDEFQCFVRPVRHPRLTAFCATLTSITQGDVDAAPGFAEAIAAFRAWLYRHPNFVFYSWGDYDRKQLAQDCAFHGVPWPIAGGHENAKRRFSHQQGLTKRLGLSEAITLAGLEFTGTHHRGIDDARNIARLMPFIVGDARLAT